MENDYNSCAKRLLRSQQIDPIIMYLVVRESLNMSVGKIAAQCAHASQMLQLEFDELDKKVHNFYLFYGNLSQEEYQLLIEKYNLFKQWLNNSFRKVVLKADDKEWKKLKELPNNIMVIDAGLTEIEPGSETVIGFYPQIKSQVPKLIKKLQVLK